MFASLHPAVLLIYFAGALILPLFISNPVYSLICLLGAAGIQLLRKGKMAVKELLFALVIIFVTALMNMLFNHMGLTVMFSVSSYDITLESLIYGISQGILFAGTLLWFTVLSDVSDSEGVIYLLSFMPRSALIFSMVLGFLPRFRKKSEDIREARLALNAEDKGKLKNAVSDFSALVNYALEGSIITAQAMEARGYKGAGITYKRYRFRAFDTAILLFSIVMIIALVAIKLSGGLKTTFEPRFKAESGVLSVLLCILFFFLPFCITLWEDIKWKRLAVKA